MYAYRQLRPAAPLALHGGAFAAERWGPPRAADEPKLVIKIRPHRNTENVDIQKQIIQNASDIRNLEFPNWKFDAMYPRSSAGCGQALGIIAPCGWRSGLIASVPWTQTCRSCCYKCLFLSPISQNLTNARVLMESAKDVRRVR